MHWVTSERHAHTAVREQLREKLALVPPSDRAQEKQRINTSNDTEGEAPPRGAFLTYHQFGGARVPLAVAGFPGRTVPGHSECSGPLSPTNKPPAVAEKAFLQQNINN